MNKKLPVTKGEIIETDILDLAYGGDSIAKYKNFTIFIPYGVPGSKVKLEIVEVKKNFARGKIIKVIKKSEFYQKPQCQYFGVCGGCDWLNIKYNKQIEYKKQIIENMLSHFSDIKNPLVRDPIRYENPFNYRNRAQYKLTFRNKNIYLGFYKARSHEVIPIDNCMIINDQINKIAKIIKDAFNYKLKEISLYNEKNQKGYLRFITVKVNEKNESLVTFVVTEKNKKEFIDYTVNKLRENISGLKGVVLNINREKGNKVFGDKEITIYGVPYIIENYSGLDFILSSASFFQINFFIYKKMVEYIEKNITPGSNVIDLYGGVGALTLPFRKKVNQIIVIDNDKANIENLKNMCKKFNLKNVYPKLANVEDITEKIIYEKKIEEAVIDPPRKGLHPKVLFILKNSDIKNIIYISCNPSTFARDMKELKEKYYLKEVIPLDQFANTYHIELIAKLEKKRKK